MCQSAHGQGLVGVFPSGGGNITITPTDGPIRTGGLEFVAEPGILTQGTNPAPFAFFIPNGAAPGNVSLGSLGTPVTIDGPIELDVAVSASAENGDIAAAWDDRNLGSPFPVTVSVPEPAGFSLAVFGIAALLGLRGRRCRSVSFFEGRM